MSIWRFAASVCTASGLLLAALPPSAGAAVAPFSYTGAEQAFVVPAGFTSVHVVAVGGKGGNGDPTPTTPAGGLGGIATADLPVSPGELLYVEVGGKDRKSVV